MPYFRVDKRLFDVDAIIPPTPNNEPINKTEVIEELLERNRPMDKPNRFSILKIFDNEISARAFWTTCCNSILYEVSINESEILHIGDYELIEKIYQEDTLQKKNSMAIEYWAGMELDDKRKKEIYVPHAKVLRILGTENERQEEQFKRYGINLDDFKMEKGK